MAASGRVGFSAQEMSNLLRADEEEDSHRQVEMREAALDSAYNAISQATGAPIGDPTDLINTHDNNGPIRSIWGSSVQVSTLAMKTYQFIRHFKKPVADGTMEAYYPKLLDQMFANGIYYLNLDMANVKDFDYDLYETVVSYPQETIPIFDMIFLQIFKSLYMNDDNQEWIDALSIETRPFGLAPKAMRELDPEDLDTLVTIQGMIIRSSSVLPDMHIGFFECSECKATQAVRVQDGRIHEPTKCARCSMSGVMMLVHNRCVYIDKQIVKLQEAPETVPEGATPQTVQLATHGLLVDVCKPGDKVLVTGIYRASEIRQLAGQSSVKQLFKTFLDVVHFKRTEKGSLSGEVSGEGRNIENGNNRNESAAMDLTTNEEDAPIRADRELNDMNGDSNGKDSFRDDDEVDVDEKKREEEFRQLASRPDIYDLLVRSLAPSIWEMEDVKKGVLCQLFGGSSKHFAEKSTGKFRSEINVLLCGDPGTSKSQLLQYVHKLSPRGIYTSGKGSSAVGLTAYITKDEDTGESVLESGALTLSDRGICCIDEFDKMTDSTRSILHEAMEQQTVSVAKAGIIATLNARTSILASANPRESRYNKKLSVVENIQLPPTLLSRFDLIYLVLDNPQRESDARLARHIVSMYFKERIQGTAEEGGAQSSGAGSRFALGPGSGNTSVGGNTGYSTLFGAETHLGAEKYLGASLNVLEPDEEARRRIHASGTLTLSTDTLRRYIAFAKRVCTPELSDESGRALVKGYVAMRKGGASQNTITATTRQLESLIRISEALAKMRLCDLVTMEDVNEAIRLMQVATYKAALDPLTGRLDMDLINTGRGAAHEQLIRNLVQQLMDFIRQYESDTVHEEQLWATIVAYSSDPVQPADFAEALHTLQDEGQIALTGAGRSRIIRRL